MLVTHWVIFKTVVSMYPTTPCLRGVFLDRSHPHRNMFTSVVLDTHEEKGSSFCRGHKVIRSELYDFGAATEPHMAPSGPGRINGPLFISGSSKVCTCSRSHHSGSESLRISFCCKSAWSVQLMSWGQINCLFTYCIP